MGGLGGEVGPLVGIVGDVVEFLVAVGVVDVAPVFGAESVAAGIAEMGDAKREASRASGFFSSGTRLGPSLSFFGGKPPSSVSVGKRLSRLTGLSQTLPALVPFGQAGCAPLGTRTISGTRVQTRQAVNFCQCCFSPRCQP